MPYFSIITPSYRNGNWLRLCIASVADQEESLEHIIQDAGSDDGTLDWLSTDPRVDAHIEKDSGMYDAINRGFRRAQGEIIAYLNCDEQYLPGALRAVREEFERHPEVDVILSDLLVTDAEGNYICHRHSLRPLEFQMWLRFNVTSCSVFLRRSFLEKHALYFDTRWKALGDFFWYKRMIECHARFRILRAYTSVFTETGDNLALSKTGLEERAAKDALTPRWTRRLRPLVLWHHRIRMLLSGAFHQGRFSYGLYTLGSPGLRVSKIVNKASGIWRRD